MGTIDRRTFWVRCDGCDITENLSASEKGSAYGASWESISRSDKFDITEIAGTYGEPIIEKAVCRGCNQEAQHRSGYA